VSSGTALHRLPLLTGVIALLCITAVWISTTDRRAAAWGPVGSPDESDARSESDVEALVEPGSRARRSENIALEVPGADAKLEHELREDEPPEVWEEVDYDNAALLVEIGLPPGAPVALLIDRSGPPDPLEAGAASVRISLFDQATGEPVGSGVVLWRLAAPANEYWTSGDQAVAHENVPATGRTFAGLPAGEYRAVCMAERLSAPDPPSFFVGGDTEAALFLTLPGERPVRLELSSGGERVTRAEVWFWPLECHGVEPHAPDWVVQREMHDPPEFSVYEGYPRMSGPPFEGEWIAVQAGPEGFDLEMFPEDRRRGRWERLIKLRTEDGRQAQVTLRNDVPGAVLRVTAEVSGE